jgi:hypothetical protein
LDCGCSAGHVEGEEGAQSLEGIASFVRDRGVFDALEQHDSLGSGAADWRSALTGVHDGRRCKLAVGNSAIGDVRSTRVFDIDAVMLSPSSLADFRHGFDYVPYPRYSTQIFTQTRVRPMNTRIHLVKHVLLGYGRGLLKLPTFLLFPALYTEWG